MISNRNLWDLYSLLQMMDFIDTMAYFISYRHYSDDPHSLPNNFVSKLFFDSNNNFWVLTNHSLVHYNYATNKFNRVAGSAQGDTSQIHSTNGIAEAADGTFFISTYDNGIKRYKNGVFPSLNKENDSLFANEDILTILLQNDTVLWLGTSDNGLITYHLCTKKVNYITKSNNRGIEAKTVYSLYEDSEKTYGQAAIMD